MSSFLKKNMRKPNGVWFNQSYHKKLNIWKIKLDEMLSQGKSYGDKTGVGLTPGASTLNFVVWTFVEVKDTTGKFDTNLILV